eukprot:1050025-Prorocentrum_minimum.AAC.7
MVDRLARRMCGGKGSSLGEVGTVLLGGVGFKKAFGYSRRRPRGGEGVLWEESRTVHRLAG